MNNALLWSIAMEIAKSSIGIKTIAFYLTLDETAVIWQFQDGDGNKFRAKFFEDSNNDKQEQA